MPGAFFAPLGLGFGSCSVGSSGAPQSTSQGGNFFELDMHQVHGKCRQQAKFNIIFGAFPTPGNIWCFFLNGIACCREAASFPVQGVGKVATWWFWNKRQRNRFPDSGNEDIMKPKAHGSTEFPVQDRSRAEGTKPNSTTNQLRYCSISGQFFNIWFLCQFQLYFCRLDVGCLPRWSCQEVLRWKVDRATADRTRTNTTCCSCIVTAVIG